MKFTEAQLEAAIIELLGVEGYPANPKGSNDEWRIMNDEFPETPAGEFLLYTTEATCKDYLHVHPEAQLEILYLTEMK